MPVATPAPLVATPAVAASVVLFPEVSGSIDIALQVNASTFGLPAGEWLIRPPGQIVRLQGPFSAAPIPGGMALTSREGRFDVVGTVEIASPCGAPIPFQAGTWRGNLLLRPNARGTFHVVNRVGLEDYLKGVVPAEMGPRVYDEIEALKAQAVAARSYAARHRGESAAEGYDLCSTPRCQVYAGAGAEHPLSSRAVEATAGEVLTYGGRIADTLFTSTCGGRTEAAQEVFPTYASGDTPYLVSVPCAGDTAIELETDFPAGRTTTALGARGRALLVSLGRTGTAWSDLVAARNALRERLGLPHGGAPKTLHAPVVYEDLLKAAQVGDLALLTEAEEWAAAPATWPVEARGGFVFAVRFALGGGTALPVDRLFSQEEAAGLYAGLLARMGDFEEVDGRLLAGDEESVTLKTAKGKQSWPVAEGAVFFSASGERYLAVASMRPFPGDRARLYVRDGLAVGLAVTLAPAAGLYERDSAWIHWTRRFTGAELMAKLRERDESRKGTVVRKLDVLERGRSGRVTRLRATTDAGMVLLAGLEVRFALAVPETLFTLATGKDEKGPVFTFYGRGWGHGVGLCQNGAYGMALSGNGYREILSHYYPGTAVAPLGGPGVK